MVAQDNSNQELGKYLLNLTHIQVKEAIYVQNQHQYMDQLINLIWSFHTREVTSVGSSMQFLKDLLILCLVKLAVII